MKNVSQIALGVLEKAAAKKDPKPGEMPEEPKLDTPFESKSGKAMWSKDQRKTQSVAGSLSKLKSFGKKVENSELISKWSQVADGVLVKMGYNMKSLSSAGGASAMNDRLSSIGNPRSFGGSDVSKASQKKPKASNVHVTQLG